MQDFTNLQVWQKSHELTLEIYRVTGEFPQNEQYGLISQMRRSSASIPTNIAEGTGRNSSTELSRFLDIALGSASELHYQLILCRDLAYLDNEESEKLIENTIQVKRMLGGFIRSIRSNRNSN